ncbi:twitching motility protein PilT [Micrococcales bacterium KH10]|nr:twitching motility protein PilT [Micrococcales bacterium KH10]
MSETNRPAGHDDYSWALGPKPVPPVTAAQTPATTGSQPVAPAPSNTGQPSAARNTIGQPLQSRAANRQQSQQGVAQQGVTQQMPPIAPQRAAVRHQPDQSQPTGASQQLNPLVPGRSSAGAAPAPTWTPGSPAAAQVIGATGGIPTRSMPPMPPASGASSQGSGEAAQAAPAAAAGSAGPPQPASSRARAASTATSGTRVGISQGLRDGDVSLDELLRYTVTMKASDLHLTRGAPPMIRRDGGLRPLEGQPELDGESLRRSVYQILTQKQRERFEEELELDFAYQVPGGSRFRVNLYQQRDSLGAAFRVIPFEIKPLESLGVPAVVGSFANIPRGLVLVTGPTGSGKSTTLASIIDLANRNRPDHIMTVEDPIEFLHEHKRSIVNQREVGEDTKSFASALKHVLRQDPDIILVGEMRDLETISVALTAAETGHLVFATLHTQDAAQTIDRVIDVFPPSQQDQVRVQLAATIQGIVCQTLCKRADGPGRVVATEIMVATPAIRNLIREGKTHQIYSSMQAGSSDGMHSMDQHLADLTKQGVISYETGLEKCQNVADFNRLTGRGSSSVGAGIANMGMGGNIEGGNQY